MGERFYAAWMWDAKSRGAHCAPMEFCNRRKTPRANTVRPYTTMNLHYFFCLISTQTISVLPWVRNL